MDMERHAGVESLLGWIQRECYEQIQGARTWAELNEVLRTNGLSLHERGNGFVIAAADGTAVKVSSIGRDCSKARLEARLGAYAPASEDPAVGAPARAYQQKPMRSRVNTVELFARYKSEQAGANLLRAEEWASARDRKNRLIEAAKRSGRFKRAAIKLLKGGGITKKILYAATSATLVGEIEKINRRYFKERQEIHQRHRRQAWADWLRHAATAGDAEALAALRARDSARNLAGNTIGGDGGHSPTSMHPDLDSVTKTGKLIYCVGATTVRDDGAKLKITRGSDRNGLQAALRIAIQRYGQCIHVDGTVAFKEQVIQAAVAVNLPVNFDDAVLERRRQELLLAANVKEKKHGKTSQPKPGRSAAGGAVGGGASLDRSAAAAARAGRSHAGAAGRAVKPNVGGIGLSPPPASKNRLRGLSALGVVRIAGGAEVLLPGDVPHHMEQQGAAADKSMRRDLSGARRVAGASEAADKFIFEREQKRLRLFDIPKFTRYDGFNGDAVLAGLRKVDGQSLALLQRPDVVMVLPVDDATARRLKRLSLGDAVTVTPQGFIKTKGRTR